MTSLDELTSDPRVQWTENILRYSDTDANGHVNNAVFSVLCESGRVDLFRRNFTPLIVPGTLWVIARLTIEFRAELNYPGTVRTGTWLTRLGRSSLDLEQVIVSNGAVAATASAVCVAMDGATRRSTPFPEDMRRVAEELLRAKS